jgi:hypothetical protein
LCAETATGNFEWPFVIRYCASGLKFRLQHIAPDHLPEDVDVLLHGHTHVPRNEETRSSSVSQSGLRDSAQPWLAASVGWLEIADGKIRWKLVPTAHVKSLDCERFARGARFGVRRLDALSSSLRFALD